jgi:sarcosine oxidase subunit beta
VATRIITGPLGVPDTMPTIQCTDFGLWIREHSGGLTWGSASAYRPAYWLEQSTGPIPPGQPRSRTLLDIQLSELPRVEKIIPRIAAADTERWLQGMPAYTPDTHLYVGMAPAHDNVIVLGGDNESGIAHGPGMGRLGSELVRGVSPFVDIRPCRLDRFDPAAFPDEKHLERHLGGDY